MRRPDGKELLDYLQCPYCRGQLEWFDENIHCKACSKKYRTFCGRPVLLSEENELFPPGEYTDNHEEKNTPRNKRRIFQRIKSLVPSRSVNIARERMFALLSREHGGQNKVVLVVGCGNQAGQLNRHFPDDKTTFLFCDIDKKADAELFCDAHELPFKNEIFDGVIATAVFEHVLYPDKVIEDIHRVIKPNGFIYSEIPFLQSVHEGAYDFTRFTMSGHRRLCEQFEEIDAGMVAGPGTALVWSIVDFFRSMFSNLRLSSFVSIISRAIFSWLKYFDYLMKDKPIALDAASCTYFYGRRQESRVSAATIIDKYHCKVFKHT